jgi:hypothetical protein
VELLSVRAHRLCIARAHEAGARNGSWRTRRGGCPIVERGEQWRPTHSCGRRGERGQEERSPHKSCGCWAVVRHHG